MTGRSRKHNWKMAGREFAEEWMYESEMADAWIMDEQGEEGQMNKQMNGEWTDEQMG